VTKSKVQAGAVTRFNAPPTVFAQPRSLNPVNLAPFKNQVTFHFVIEFFWFFGTG
jgi:hypothetical protein